MNQDRAKTASHVPAATDIVAGPVGSARLRNPATSGPMGADLGELAAVDPATDDMAGPKGSIGGSHGSAGSPAEPGSRTGATG